MRRDFVILGGWSRVISSYQKIIETAPNNSHVYCIPHTSIISDVKIPSTEEIHLNISKKIEKLQLSYYTLIGHSLGGAFAISFASKHPKNIQKLILVDSEGIPNKQGVIRIALYLFENDFLHYGRAKALENVKAFFRIMHKLPLFLKVGRYFHNIDLRKEAQEIKVPTIILWGGKIK